MLRFGVTIAALVGILLLATGGYAAIPSADGTVVGCYNNNNGALKVIDAEAGVKCSGKETQLALATSHDHFSGIERVHDEAFFEGFAGQMVTARAVCPPGKVLMNGGFTLSSNNANEADKVDIVSAVPIADSSIGEFAYQVRAITNDVISTPWSVTAYAVCANNN